MLQQQVQQAPVERTGLSRYFHASINWIYTQSSLSAMTKSLIVLTIFGFVPGSWLIGLPALAVYGVARVALLRHRDPVRFRAIFAPYVNNIRLLIDNVSQFTAQRLARYIADNPLHVAKMIAAFCILFAWSMPFSFFTIYGMFRFTNEEWLETFNRRANNIYDGTLGLVIGANHRLSFWFKLGAFSAACVAIGSLSYFFGGLSIMTDLAITLLEMCATTVGMTAITRDIGYMLKNPIKVFTDHPGKFYGMIWGRWLSFALFPGRVIGSMGPAVGHVDAAGVVPSIFGALFPATQAQGWFTFGSGLGGLLATRFVSFINSIVSSVFFSYNMRLQGDFYGVLGPTSFQIFGCMAIGCLLGYAFEGIANRIYETAARDAHAIADASRPRVNSAGSFLYRNRWQIGFVAGITPVVLATPGGAIFYTLGMGSAVLATSLTALTGVAGLAVIYGTANGVRAVVGRLFRSREVPVPAVMIVEDEITLPAVVALTAPVLDVNADIPPQPAAVFVPGFEGQQAQRAEQNQPLAPAVPIVIDEHEPLAVPVLT